MRRNLKLSAVGVVIVSAWVVTGCSSSDRSTSPSTLTPFETGILADGVVTRAEIESARSKTVKCLAEAGFTASFERESDRVSSLAIDSGFPRPGESDQELETRFHDAADLCANDYLIPIDHAWIRASAPSAQEARAAYQRLQACVKPFGVTLSEDPPAGLRPLFERLQDTLSTDPAVRSLEDCFSTYSLATSTAEP